MCKNVKFCRTKNRKPWTPPGGHLPLLIMVTVPGCDIRHDLSPYLRRSVEGWYPSGDTSVWEYCTKQEAEQILGYPLTAELLRQE